LRPTAGACPGVGLRYSLLSGAEYQEVPGSWPLGAIGYGGRVPEPTSGVAIKVDLPWLGGAGDLEVWSTSVLPSVERLGESTVALAGPLLFATIGLPAAGAVVLEQSTRHAYSALLRLARRVGRPHPLRFWNVLPHINEEQEGLERYRRFCRARAEAFEECYGAEFVRELCAASAVGSAAGPLLVSMLACAEPGHHRENPRQVSAFRYPREHGPRSPSFARATLCPGAVGGRLLLSGTASIVGHRTEHPDCVGCQLDETLRNLRALRTQGSAGDSPGDLSFRALKVFLRHPEHLPEVQGRLESEVGAALPVLYLQADICRRPLLIEIEGIA
jgi:chorismate lyase / 3-hydroxybenzoate synthase